MVTLNKVGAINIMNFKLDYLTIDDSTRQKLLDWALENRTSREYFVHTGVESQYCTIYNKDTEITKLVNTLAQQKFTEAGIVGSYIEPKFGHFIGICDNGSYYHQENGNNYKELIHVRINLLLSKSESNEKVTMTVSGNDYTFDVEEGEFWLSLSGLHTQHTEPVIGDKPRIFLSLGGLMPLHTLKLLFSEYFPEIEWVERPNQMIMMGSEH
jgi:hypothetical protein